VGVAVLLVAGACGGGHSGTTGSASSGGGTTTSTAAAEPTKATEVGITPTEIHIGVMADVDTAFAPGLFQGSVDGVKGFADWINKSGGLAGRKVVVDFYDSKLSPDEARNGIVKACQNDFALVGTTALFENNVDDMIACKDVNAAATGLPEIPELQTEPVQQQAKVSFPVLPPNRDWSQPTETYHSMVGPTKWFLANAGTDLHGIWLNSAAVKSAKNSNLANFRIQQQLGIKLDQEFDFLGTESQSQYTPVVQAIKTHNSTYARSGLDFTSTVKLRKEANVQGVTTVKVWECSFQCYDQKFLTQGGSDVEGTYVWSQLLPFEEAGSAKGVQEYLDAVGADKANGFGLQAFAAALLFRDAVNALAKGKGVNSLTRANLLTQLANTHQFNADGITGNDDIGANQNGKAYPPCWMMMQVKNGKFVRIFPKDPGTLDCSPGNVQTASLHVGG